MIDFFELIFVDKNFKPVTTEEWLAGREGTWQLKHRYIVPIVLIFALPFILIVATILIVAKFVLDCTGFNN